MPDPNRRELLAKIPLFAELETRELDALSPATRIQRVKARETLYRKGDPGRSLAVVVEGAIKVFNTSADGTQVVFGVFGPGEVVGELALFLEDERTASVMALEETELLTLDRRDFFVFLRTHPRVAEKLLGVLALRVRRVSQMVEDTLFLNLPSRLARKLVAYSENYGKRMREGILIDLKLSQTEWGDLVGATRESINTQLRAWTEDGILKFDRGYITIQRLDALEALTDLAL